MTCAEGGLGFAQTAELPPDDADVVQGLRAGRVEGERAFKGGQRFLRADRARRACRQGWPRPGANPGSSSAARWNDSLALTMSSDAQPQLAALVMGRGPLRRLRDRLVEVARRGLEIVDLDADAGGCHQRRGVRPLFSASTHIARRSAGSASRNAMARRMGDRLAVRRPLPRGWRRRAARAQPPTRLRDRPSASSPAACRRLRVDEGIVDRWARTTTGPGGKFGTQWIAERPFAGAARR